MLCNHTQGRDGAHQSCATVPSASLRVGSTWVSTTIPLCTTIRVLQRRAAPELPLLPQLHPHALPQPCRNGAEGARNQEHSTGRKLRPHRKSTLQQGFRRKFLLGEPGLSLKLCCTSDDALSSCRGLCLTHRFPRDCGILTMINMTWLASLAIFCGVGTWRASVLLRRSFLVLFPRGKTRHTHFPVLPGSQQDEAMFIRALGNIGRSPSVETRPHGLFCHEGPRGSERSRKDGHVIGVSDHLFADMMAIH